MTSRRIKVKSTRITALYVRTSTSKQEKGHQAQIMALNDYCTRNNIQNIKVFEDFGVTGTRSNRAGLNALMEHSRKGKIEHVIVYSFSRFARSTKHLLNSLETFESLSIRFTSISEDIDTSSPLGKAMFVIISALSALERDILSERTKLGLKNAKAKGKKLGRPKSRNSKLIEELSNQGFSQRKIAELTGV
jgi:DNA invertase Pin-like site-specific DNA recombinase